MLHSFLITAGAFAIFFVFIGIRIILKKDGQFRGSCSSQNITGDDTCSICGRETDEGCGEEDAAMAAALAEENKK